MFLTVGRYKILPSGNLQISKVRQVDQGAYRCISVNPITAQKKIAQHVVNLRVIGEYPFSRLTVSTG